MMEAGVGALRVLRVLVFVSLATSLTIAGHVLGGGSASFGAVVALAALSWPIALLGSRRQRGVRQLFPTLAAAQVGGHAVLAFFGGAGSGAGSSCATGTGHHGHPVLDCADPLGAAAMTHGAHGVTPTMTVAHVAAALALSILLAHGEAILWRVVTLATPSLPRLAPLDLDVLPVAFLLGRRSGRRDLALPTGRGPPVAA